MKTKQVALFFVFLLSSEYLLEVAAAVAGPHLPCCHKVRRQTGCRIKPELEKKLDESLERIRLEMPDSFDMPDSTVEEYEISQGVASGFRNFEKKSYRCRCGRNLVRIFITVSFLRILLTFVLNLLDDLLGGLLGSLGSALSRVLGNIVNLLVRVLALDIIVQITILQRFIPGTRCIVESYRVSKLVTIKLLGLNLRPLAEILSPILTPVLDLLLQLIFNGRVKEIFVAEFHKLIITRTEVICG